MRFKLKVCQTNGEINGSQPVVRTGTNYFIDRKLYNLTHNRMSVLDLSDKLCGMSQEVMNDLKGKDVNATPALKQESSKSPAAKPHGTVEKVTPMMAQFIEIKAANPDSLLFYRMGDFYELFFDDAEEASKALGITLTKRGKHNGEDIPMCGVPVHTADDYLQRLIKAGFRVAVCEQLENPAEAKKRGNKSVVRRDVVRLVTRGTLTEDTLLDARSHNYLACVVRLSHGSRFALAWVDISTGEFKVTAVDDKGLGAELARLSASEIILSDALMQDATLEKIWEEQKGVLAPMANIKFDSASAERQIKAFYGVKALDGFGNFSRAELSACGALIDYISITQKGACPAIRPPEQEHAGSTLMIDAATRTNLELTRTLSGAREGSLLHVIDRTVTGAGGRRLASRMASPSTNAGLINSWLDDVDYYCENTSCRAALRKLLQACPDLARALSRISVDRSGPRDLGALRDGLIIAEAIPELMSSQAGLSELSGNIKRCVETLSSADTSLRKSLQKQLAEELPLKARDGGFIAKSVIAELDECLVLRDESRKFIAGLQARYSADTGIKTLKIKHNNVLGYFIEITAQYGQKLMAEPFSQTFIHRQTLANVVRFTTVELGELVAKLSSAADRALSLELNAYEQMTQDVRNTSAMIASISDAMSELDVAAGLAELAIKERYNRPKIDDSGIFSIKRGRHPVVEVAIQKEVEGGFVPNNCVLDASPKTTDDKDAAARITLLTGPNMAGKSTYLRQNALMVVLAQMGSRVPAKTAHIGIVDRLFSRVGAADDLARGRSTFMVEMVETAAILNQATARSLVILDEIGRGTATFDGLSIAWACVEHLHEINGCRALFATHFHELTALTEILPHLVNATMRVKEWQNEVIFLHEVGPGSADRSYGIQVAKLAGLPNSVTIRATQVLQTLEENDRDKGSRSLSDDLPLFSVMRPQSKLQNDKSSKIEEYVETLQPDQMTPLDALEKLYALKKLMLKD